MLTLVIGDLFIPDRAIGLPEKFKRLLAPNSLIPLNPKISQVLCCGNLTLSVETIRFLNNISPSFHLVRGEFDNVNLLSLQVQLASGSDSGPIPLYKVVVVDQFRVGITGGQHIVPRNDPLALLAFAREINVDILIWGGTHRVEAYTLDGKYFINAGSATGADPDTDTPEGAEDDAEPEENPTSAGSESKNDVHQEADPTSAGSASAGPDTIPSFCLLDTSGSRCTLYIYTYVDDEVKVDKVSYQKE